METYELSHSFEIGGLLISPTHVRIERLSPVIAAHRHSNTSYEIHFTDRGSGTVSIEGERYSVEPGTLYVTGPNVLHAQLSNPTDPIVEYCLYLNCRPARHANAAKSLEAFQRTGFWMGADALGVFHRMCALIDERRRNLPDMEEMSEALLREIIVCLNRSYRAPRSGGVPSRLSAPDESRYYPLVEDAFFYRHAALRLADLAALLNLSQRQTQRFLIRHYGKTFSQKRTDARMAAAAELLRASEMSVTRIAEQTGYSSVEHFSTAFRRCYQLSPTAFRRQSREK